MEDILDHEEEALAKTNPKLIIRILPLIIEAGPILIAIIGLAINNAEMITVGFLTAAFSYVALSWYFFKAEKFNIVDIFFATFFGIGMGVALMSAPFELLNWEGASQMLFVGMLTINFCIVLSLFFLVLKLIFVKNKKQELTMSVAIFIRFFLLQVFYYAFELNVYYDQLIQQS